MPDDEGKKKAEKIASAAQAACILEASCEKPGNVSPAHSFKDADYHDYLLGSLALRASILKAAERGFLAGEEKIRISEVGIGELIHMGACDVKKAHSGGNTHLGILLLLIPISAASGYCLAKKKAFGYIRKAIGEIVSSTTKKDSEFFYSAIKTCGAGALGKLIEKDVSFHELMKLSAEGDLLAGELSGDAQIIFDLGLPAFEVHYAKTGSLEDSLLNAYLLMLSKHPDTWIAKKAGRNEAEKVSVDAGKVLKGDLSLEEFDLRLRKEGNLLNPGTTADLSCAVLFLWLLKEKVF